MAVYVGKHGRISRGDAAELCKIGPYQASRLPRKLEDKGELRLVGERRRAYYERAHKGEK